MRYNTLIQYPNRAQFRTWRAVQGSDRLTYRAYDDPTTIRCSVSMLSNGSLFVASSTKLQNFGILYNMTDPAGVRIMDETWYSIQGATPVFDGAGYISSYRHRIAVLAASLIGDPIDPPQEYPDLDQG